MGEYVSSVPVSRPRNTGWEISWDCGGMLWSNDFGMFFHEVDETVPIRKPARVLGRP